MPHGWNRENYWFFKASDRYSLRCSLWHRLLLATLFPSVFHWRPAHGNAPQEITSNHHVYLEHNWIYLKSVYHKTHQCIISATNIQRQRRTIVAYNINAFRGNEAGIRGRGNRDSSSMTRWRPMKYDWESNIRYDTDTMSSGSQICRFVLAPKIFKAS